MPGLEARIIKKVFRAHVPADSKILDIACGLGDKMRLLASAGYHDTMGIEINPASVEACRQQGLNVCSLDDFTSTAGEAQYDVLLMSHIIEHFEYRELIEFIESYLAYLKPGGLFIVITPVLNSYFYDAFDHVKPYSHIGILDIFGEQRSTEPVKSAYRLSLVDLQYVRLAFQLKFYRALTLNTRWRILPRLINQLFHLVYRLSFRTVGVPSSWIGVFRKAA